MEYRNSVLSALVYSDIFDCPLTKEQLWRYAIERDSIDKDRFDKDFEDASPLFSKKNDWYALKEREGVFTHRIRREKESRKKWPIAKKVARSLSFIPTIKLIGVSGSLSLGNAEKDDDIDLFIVTSRGTLWVTRMIVLCVLEVLGVRRSRESKNNKNKICVNMFIDESTMRWGVDRRNLYSAHEIVNLAVIFQRDGAYKKFILANQWVRTYLPNALTLELTVNRNKNKIIHALLKNMLLFVFILVESFAKYLQLWYMRKFKTKEITQAAFAAFLPRDYTNTILRKYETSLYFYNMVLTRMKNKSYGRDSVSVYEGES